MHLKLTFCCSLIFFGSFVPAFTKIPFEGDHVMVVGGDPQGQSVELVQVGGGEDLSCVEIEDYSLDLLAGVSGIVEGLPTVCGDFPNDETCYQYVFSGNYWRRDGIMRIGRSFAGYDSDPDWGIAVVGGWDGFYHLEEFEVTDTGNSRVNFELLAILPAPKSDPCLAILDSGRIFVAGGSPSDHTAYIYTRNNEWQKVSDLPQERDSHVCGVVRNGVSGGLEVVVAGGLYDPIDTVDIYSVETDSWRPGTPLPQPISKAAKVAFEDSFLIVGGDNGTDYLDTVYKYEVLNDAWNLMPQRLKVPRADHTAILVRSEDFPQDPCVNVNAQS